MPAVHGADKGGTEHCLPGAYRHSDTARGGWAHVTCLIQQLTGRGSTGQLVSQEQDKGPSKQAPAPGAGEKRGEEGGMGTGEGGLRRSKRLRSHAAGRGKDEARAEE